jgi:hypothetical protein
MTNATPKQIRLYRHRKIVLLVVQLGMIPAVPISAAILLKVFVVGTHIDFGVAILIALAGPMLLLAGSCVFRHVYFRCPVCSYPFPGGKKYNYFRWGEFFKGHCNACGTDYAA